MPRRFLTFVACLALAAVAAAEHPRSLQGLFCPKISPCPRVCGCPDDYCRKPCPTILPFGRCGGPDDYCRKPAPCLLDLFRCGGCDDYCRKPLPTLFCPPQFPCTPCAPPTRCEPAHRR